MSDYDTSSPEWDEGFAAGMLGHRFDDTRRSDDSYTEGWITGDAEIQNGFRTNANDNQGRLWDVAVGPSGKVLLAETSTGTRIWLPHQSVTEAATRLHDTALP